MAGKVDAAKQRFFDEIDYVPPGDNFHVLEQEALFQILTSTIFKRAVSFAYAEIRGMMTGLVRAELTTQSGIADALKKQGSIAGFSRAFESLFDLLEELNLEPAKEDK